MIGDVEALEDLGVGVFTRGRGAFVPRHILRIVRIEGGDRHAVEVGDKAILKFHPQS